MANETEVLLQLLEESSSTTTENNMDESAYSIFFTTFNPNSPAYSNNLTDFGISIKLLKFCLEGVGITTVSVLGVIGNILSIIVLSAAKMKSSSSCFLMLLAVSDIVTLIGALLIIGIPSLLAFDLESEEVTTLLNQRVLRYGYLIPPLYALAVTGVTGSIWSTMALTLERYLAVCRPFFARYLCTWTRACCLSVIIAIASILFNLPRFFEYTFEIEECENYTIYRPVPTAFRMIPEYDAYYAHMSYFVFLFFVPICFLIVFNILIYREIKAANKLRKSSSPSQKHELSLTRILFSVVAIFLICHLSPAFHSFYRYIRGSRDLVPEAEFLWCFMIVFNSSVNFLIYCASGSKFREVFCDSFCCWRTTSRFRQFAASTKTTFRSFSSSSTARSRIYSIYSHRGSARRDTIPTVVVVKRDIVQTLSTTT